MVQLINGTFPFSISLDGETLEQAGIISRSSWSTSSAKKKNRGNVDEVDVAILKILASSQDTQMEGTLVQHFTV